MLGLAGMAVLPAEKTVPEDAGHVDGGEPPGHGDEREVEGLEERPHTPVGVEHLPVHTAELVLELVGRVALHEPDGAEVERHPDGAPQKLVHRHARGQVGRPAVERVYPS